MKKKVKKILVFSFVTIFLSIIAINIYSFQSGYVGVTNKGGEGTGCICHGTHAPTPAVSVFFVGPDSVQVGQTVIYNVKLAHGPAIVGGFDAAVYAGIIDTVYTETGVRRDSLSGELTHSHPKPFTNDTVSWSFKYTAPAAEQIDTLYAVANSTNNDTTSDNDDWNFSPNFTIRVYNPIGIKNHNSIAESFHLYQNYPNPFNPATKIKFDLNKDGIVRLEIFDISGKSISVPVNGQERSGKHEIEFNGNGLSSGIYFYRLNFTSSDRNSTGYTEVRKMILVK